MPRLGNRVPAYCRHKRKKGHDLAYVLLSGRTIYLGPHGTKRSKREYDRILEEWLANDRRLPAEDESPTITQPQPGSVPVCQPVPFSTRFGR